MGMEEELGFIMETRRRSEEVVVNGNYKLVPWISWDDWNFVCHSLFSSSSPSSSISSALRRISAWQSRGCVPVVIEVTASIIATQQKDPFFRDDLNDKDLQSEETLTSRYCMAIMRLVNGVVEKTRKRTEVSIAEAADAIGLPRMLIDIRHECSHRDLPSLRLVRVASNKALDWLKSYYWEPQKNAIPNPSDKAANLRKEIKSTIRELFLSLNIQQIEHYSSSAVKRKRSKKQITKLSKNIVRLYNSFSSDVVSVVLELLLKALDSANLEDLLKTSQGGITDGSLQTVFDEWKPVIRKLTKKEPEILLTLLKGVLHMIEAREGGEYLTSLQETERCKTEQLLCLFEWLIDNLKELKPSSSQKSAADIECPTKETYLPKASLVDIMQKCLLIPLPGKHQLTSVAIVLARMIGNELLVEKLIKLASLHASSNEGISEEETLPLSGPPESKLSQQEDYIRQAAKKLENIKSMRMKGNKLQTVVERKWMVAKSWNPCPIGMLPSVVGSSGLLPVLDYGDDYEEAGYSSESNKVKQCSGRKREAERGIEVLDDCNVKKMKESGETEELMEEELVEEEGTRGRIMMGGVWERVSKEDILAVASTVRILV